MLCIFTTANAKTKLLGNGSGSVSQTSMTGLNAGDTIAIMPGTYSGGGNFSDLHDITIINNGGVVNFNGTVIWGGNTMHNIKWTGVGYSGAFYGFVFNNPSTPFSGIYGAALHTDSARFDHLDFENISLSAFDFSNNYYAITYNGSSSTFKMHCVTFSDIKVYNSSNFIVTGYNSPSSPNNNLCDSIDMHNIIIQDLKGAGEQVRGTMTHFNVYNWHITYSGYNTNAGDQGILYLSGNGSIHNNYMHGGRGYLARINGFSIKPMQDSVLFYNNIILSTTHYGGFDIRCDSTDIPWNTAPFLNPIKNVYVLNNTVGNKQNDPGAFNIPIVVQYLMHNNNILYCKNNLGFAADPNVSGLPAAAFIVDYGGGKIDSSNNRYYNATTILSKLQDTLITCRPQTNSDLNGVGTVQDFLITDFYGNKRPTPPSIGAVEYAGILSAVLANAGVDQTITLPLDSVSLSGAASTVINSTISSYQWSQISGPSTAKLRTPNLVNTQASSLKAGVYLFGLKVSDNNNDSSSANVTIIVNPQNLPPIPNAGPNQIITAPISIVSVDGSLSSDPDGTISSFSWSQVSGPSTSSITNPNGAKSTISGLVPGIYVFNLSVTDNLGLSASALITITVNVATSISPNPNGNSDMMFVFPNPAKNWMSLEVSNELIGIMTVSILDARGSLIFCEKVNKTEVKFFTPINVSSLPTGGYFLLVNINNLRAINTKFIKQ